VATALVCISVLPVSGVAQSPAGEVTFEVPLQLTRLAPDITKVRVMCVITSSAFETLVIEGVASRAVMSQVEIPVTGGQVVTNATVVVAIPAGALTNPEKASADYECSIMGYSIGRPTVPRGTTGAGWDGFDAGQRKPSFQITPTPANIVGKFPWVEAAPPR
jgi:hypothetical protein